MINRPQESEKDLGFFIAQKKIAGGNIMNLHIDSEFRSLIPPLTPEELSGLEKSLIDEGCRDALVIWEGIIIDGHNRFEICQREDIPFRILEKSFENREDVKDWIEGNQLARRNLAPDQMSLLRGRRYNRAKKTQGGDHKSKDQIDTLINQADRLSKEHGVSSPTIKRDGKVAEFLDQYPKEATAVLRGEKKLTDVRKEIRREKQIEKENTAVAKIAKNEIPPWTITSDQSVIQCAALITDPPYGILSESWDPQELEKFTRDWAAKWSRCGADFILSFFSQRFMWQGRQWFDESLHEYEFQQLLIWHYPNNIKPQSQKGFKQTWEPIFFYRRMDSKKEITLGAGEWGDGLNTFDCHVAAVPQSNFNDAERKVHPAQKPVSVMRWLINATTNPGEIVADPFCGSGTTGIAATQLGRKFHGIEKDAGIKETAEKRIICYGRI